MCLGSRRWYGSARSLFRWRALLARWPERARRPGPCSVTIYCGSKLQAGAPLKSAAAMVQVNIPQDSDSPGWKMRPAWMNMQLLNIRLTVSSRVWEPVWAKIGVIQFYQAPAPGGMAVAVLLPGGGQFGIAKGWSLVARGSAVSRCVRWCAVCCVLMAQWAWREHTDRHPERKPKKCRCAWPWRGCAPCKRPAKPALGAALGVAFAHPVVVLSSCSDRPACWP